MVRSKNGRFEFKYNESGTELYAHVELPIPGATGMAAFATVLVPDGESEDSRAGAVKLAYETCRAKLLTMNPPKVSKTITSGDQEILRVAGIKWEDK